MSARLRRALTVIVALAALAVALVALLAPHAAGGGSGASTAFYGTTMPPAFPAVDFTLRDEQGHEHSLRSLAGHVVLLAFLSTACGAGCAVAGSELEQVLADLPLPIPFVAVSIDPARDTPARVRAFLAADRLLVHVTYLTGSLAALRPIWRRFGISPRRGEIAQSLEFVLLDRDGRARVSYEGAVVSPDALVGDIIRVELLARPQRPPARTRL